MVVARPDARELAEREGMDGVRAALAELVDGIGGAREADGERRCVRSRPPRSALYPRLISPALPARCKYHPSCSAYAVQAIERYGILRGSVLAAWRLLRCNPFSHGGYDPVAAPDAVPRRARVTLLAPMIFAANSSSR